MHSLPELTALVDSHFSQNEFNYEPTGLYRPVKHIMNIKGKRIRPLLLLMACDMFGGDVKAALDPAFSVEVFHNFTLVHDDIMDNASLRRGVKTVHEVFGNNSAILAGDAMLSYAYKYLCKVPDNKLRAALQVFNKAAIEIYEGQQMDIDFEQRNNVTIPEYLRMIEFKTSVLLAASLQIGSLIADASESDQKKLYDFGLNLGLSFQIKDDWLDTFGDGAKVGKRIGGDILQNKKTYLLITALNDAGTAQSEQLTALFNEKNEAKKIDAVLALFSELNVSAKTQTKIDELYTRSLESLRAVSLSDERKAGLMKLAESIHARDY